jgi:hypothetical protein
LIKSDWSGLDKLQKRAEKLDGNQEVPLNELFKASFMDHYTSHSTIDEFIKAGGFVFETNEDFENIPEEKLDQHVRNSTNFESWNEMLNKAGEHWIAKELGF